MNTNALKRFAPAARSRLMDMVGVKLDYVLSADTAELRGKAGQLRELQKQVDATSRTEVIEHVAYTWFNRFMALRFMDANSYTDIKVVSPVEGHTLPEILAEAKRGNIAEELKVDRIRINDLLDGRISSADPQTEVFKLLLVAVCNHYYGIMPFMFEPIDDYTELLMPDDLLGEGGVLHGFLENMADADCHDVEIVGWMYQFYISEKKDDVFAALKKKKKITPEKIPAATQLFTPHWIVRYLVENSLGRLWILNHPDSKLVDQMEYYIKPEKPETEFLKIDSPEEIKVCDPACGSGHMLTYAFDLLYAIYEEQGYNASEIPEKILANNLYGIEIDERAGELAAFALFMKGRQKYRRFFRKPVQPNICVLQSVCFEEGELKSYMDEVGRDLFTAPLQSTLQQFSEVHNFGSLIIPKATDVGEMKRLLYDKDLRGNLLLHGIHQKVLQVLEMADYLGPKYHCVVANPPYMGGKGMNQKLATWLKDNYADVKSDLFSAFMVRNTKLALSKGQLGFMTPFVWMFISTYEKLRSFLINQKTITSLVQLEYSGFDGATVPICTFTIENDHDPEFEGGYVRLSDFRGSENQGPKTLEAIRNPDCGWFSRASAADFKKIPGCPIAYWLSPTMLDCFAFRSSLSEVCNIREGINTGDNDKFLRLWSEVDWNRFSHQAELTGESKPKWLAHRKGGQFRKWYGNRDYVVNWECDGRDIHDFHNLPMDYNGAPVRGKAFFFHSGLSWSRVSSGSFALRYYEAGMTYDSTAPSIFSDPKDTMAILGLLNSCVVFQLLAAMSPTLDFRITSLGRLPFVDSDSLLKNLEGRKLPVESVIDISRSDWNSYEISWDFVGLPLLNCNYQFQTLEETYAALSKHWKEMTLEMQRLEEENNRIFIDAYDLQDELKPEVPLNEITLTCNPYYRFGDNKTDDELEAQLLADTMKEFISYAVGCMFGRYSLDKPGLILANQGETLKEFLRQVPKPTFTPDDDNVIPVLDDEYFVDDVVGRFKTFLRGTFGGDHYDENLTFIEEALGKNIRKYFLSDFYAHHLQMYKKRPIYWLFSSPKKSFNVLIYMHRYRPDTVSRILNEYLREFVEKLKARRANQKEISISESARASDKSKATKEMGRIDKILAELDDYERSILFPLAAKKVEIDLDDGVKVNYNKFGDALRKVPGLSGR